MAAPGTSPVEWAEASSTHTASGEAWDGLANKVDPGAGKIAAGWEPEDNPAAEHINYVLNNFGMWLEYIHNFFDTANDEYQYDAVKVRTVELDPLDFVGDGWSKASGFDHLQSAGSGDICHLGLAGVVPSGAYILSVQAIVKPANTGLTRLLIDAVEPDWATPANNLSTTAESDDADGTTNWQMLSITPSDAIFQDVDHSTHRYHIQINSAQAGDLIKAVRVSFSDPGPRNF